jgi:hypothetical protein
VSQISHREQLAHCTISHETSIKDMKCSISVLIGDVTANELGSGYQLWMKSVKFFSNSSTKRDRMCPKSATESSWHIDQLLVLNGGYEMQVQYRR